MSIIGYKFYLFIFWVTSSILVSGGKSNAIISFFHDQILLIISITLVLESMDTSSHCLHSGFDSGHTVGIP